MNSLNMMARVTLLFELDIIELIITLRLSVHHRATSILSKIGTQLMSARVYSCPHMYNHHYHHHHYHHHHLSADVGPAARLQVLGQRGKVVVDASSRLGQDIAQITQLLESLDTKHLEGKEEHDELPVLDQGRHGQRLQHRPDSEVEDAGAAECWHAHTGQQVARPLGDALPSRVYIHPRMSKGRKMKSSKSLCLWLFSTKIFSKL